MQMLFGMLEIPYASYLKRRTKTNQDSLCLVVTVGISR